MWTPVWWPGPGERITLPACPETCLKAGWWSQQQQSITGDMLLESWVWLQCGWFEGICNEVVFLDKIAYGSCVCWMLFVKPRDRHDKLLEPNTMFSGLHDASEQTNKKTKCMKFIHTQWLIGMIVYWHDSWLVSMNGQSYMVHSWGRKH